MKLRQRFKKLLHIQDVTYYPMSLYGTWRFRAYLVGVFTAMLIGLTAGEIRHPTGGARVSDLVVGSCILICATLFCLWRAARARRRAIAEYGNTVDTLEAAWLTMARQLRTALLYGAIGIVSYLGVAWPAGEMPPAALVLSRALIISTVASFFLLPFKKPSLATQLERTNILSAQVEQISEHVVNDVRTKLHALRQERAKVEEEEGQLQKIIQQNLTSGINAILATVQKERGRKELQQGWMFAIVGFVLGLIGNWLYDSFLR